MSDWAGHSCNLQFDHGVGVDIDDDNDDGNDDDNDDGDDDGNDDDDDDDDGDDYDKTMAVNVRLGRSQL